MEVIVTVAANPSVAGINTSAKVAKMVKNAGQVWGGSFLTLDGPINFALSRATAHESLFSSCRCQGVIES